eukprot:COSAG04_NODE_5629_length_1545_cov_11.686030_1_plen_46_part_10
MAPDAMSSLAATTSGQYCEFSCAEHRTSRFTRAADGTRRGGGGGGG